MPHEGLADCTGCVVTGGDEDGVLGETVNEDGQVLVASIWRQRHRHVDGEGIIWSLRLDGARRLLAMAIIDAQLALWAALDGLQRDAATCFMGIVVTEELPQSVAAEVGGSMQFAGDFSGFIFIVQQANLKEGIFRGRGVDGQVAESIHMSLGFPGAVFYGEIVFLQGGRPAMKESRPCVHCFEPL